MEPDYVLRAPRSSFRCVAIVGSTLLPLAAVERRHGHRFDGIAVDAARVHADPIGVRAWNVERLHAARGAEIMLGDVCIERIRRERFAAAEKFESLGRHDQMQIPGLAAHGAVAVGDLEVRRCDYFEADAAAVTTAAVRTHGAQWPSALVLLRREIADQRQ